MSAPTGVYAVYRGERSKIAMFESLDLAAQYVTWVKGNIALFPYDRIEIVGAS